MLSNIGFITQGRPLLSPNERVANVERYEVLVPPANKPLSLDEIKVWLKIPLTQTEEDVLLQTLIDTAAIMFEDYTNRILINTTFRNFSNCFAQSFEFSRGHLQSLVSFQYLNQDNNFIDIESSTYQVLDETFYWRIIFAEFNNLPQDKQDEVNVFQGIRTDFVAGFGENASDIPADIILGLKNHIASLYENRGDCNSGDCVSCGSLGGVPSITKTIYNKYRHQTIYGAKYRGI